MKKYVKIAVKLPIKRQAWCAGVISSPPREREKTMIVIAMLAVMPASRIVATKPDVTPYMSLPIDPITVDEIGGWMNA